LIIINWDGGRFDHHHLIINNYLCLKRWLKMINFLREIRRKLIWWFYDFIINYHIQKQLMRKRKKDKWDMKIVFISSDLICHLIFFFIKKSYFIVIEEEKWEINKNENNNNKNLRVVGEDNHLWNEVCKQ